MNFSDMLMMCYLSSHCGKSRDFMCCVYNTSLYPQALMTARNREPVCIKSGVCWSWSLLLQVTPTLSALFFIECLFEKWLILPPIGMAASLHHDPLMKGLQFCWFYHMTVFWGHKKAFGGKFFAFKVAVNHNGPHTIFIFEKDLSCMAIILINRWGKIKKAWPPGEDVSLGGMKPRFSSCSRKIFLQFK